MLDVLAVDHHPETEIPLWDDELVLEARHAGGEGRPMAALGGEVFERQPAPVANLDCVGAAPSGQQPEHVPLEKRGVHADSRGRPRPRRPCTASINSRRKAAACLESCTLPGRFLSRRMWPVWATWASSG